MRVKHFLSRGLAVIGVVAVALPAASWAAEREPLDVVASFSLLGDMVQQIGGDRVTVTTLVGPDGDAHVYQPSPADARAVADAKLLVVNGLGFEGWMERLVQASGYDGPVVVASKGVTVLKAGESDDHAAHEDHAAHDHSTGHHHHGGIDPHAWQSLGNARIYVANILSGLQRVDPEGGSAYQARADRYLAEIDALETELRQKIAALPPSRRLAVTSHDAFGYFEAAYGITFLAPVGVSTEAEPSAREVATLIRQIKTQGIPAIFIESISNPRLLDQVARETGARIGGTLYPGSLSGPDGPAPTYLDMMRHNIETLTKAMAGS